MRAVLALIEKGTQPSRASIAKSLGLSRTTISTLVSRLMETGIVTETGVEVEGPGRPGISLDLSDDQWFAIGVEYHSGVWILVITDLRGTIYKQRTLSVAGTDPEEFLTCLKKGLKNLIREVPGRLLPAVGIGTPGLVDCGQGRIIQADDLGWREVRISEYLERQLGITSYIINRHRAGGLAAARFGSGRGVHSFIYIGIGTGISAAIVSEGVLLHGTNYSAGEIGHMTMDTTGPRCQCGKTGCLHTLASGTAMKKQALARLRNGESSSLQSYIDTNKPISGEIVAAEASQGDPLAMSCLRDAAAWMGIAVANLITTFNPDKIILGGPIGSQPGPLLQLIRDETARWALEYPFQAASIEQEVLGEDAGALGAACLVLDRKLDLVLL